MNVPTLSPVARARIHLVMMAVWALLLIPTVLWWRDSILWVCGMSLYANFVGHYGAYEAAREDTAEDQAED